MPTLARKDAELKVSFQVQPRAHTVGQERPVVKREGIRSTPRLAGTGARSAQGTDTCHENAEDMASVSGQVKRPVRYLCANHGLLEVRLVFV